MNSKKINKVISSFILIVMSISCISCEKFLEKKPDDRVSSPKNANDLQTVLDHAVTMNQRLLHFDEFSADDFFLTEANFDGLTEHARAAYLWIPFIRENDASWRNASSAIYVSNVCIETAEKFVKEGEKGEAIDNVLGSAHFYRGYHLLKMAFTYCKAYDKLNSSKDLGLIIRSSADPNIPSVRSTIEESYSFIINDFEAALKTLPIYSLNKMRPSKLSAHAALARTYLSMREYEKAHHHVDEALKLYSDLLDYNNLTVGANFPFQSLNSEVIFHSEVSQYSFGNITNLYLIDTNLHKSYEDNDLRKTVFFANSGQFHRFKGTYSGNNAAFNGLTTAELYLIKAESMARSGKTQEALNHLNTLISKRWNNKAVFNKFSTTDNAQALKWILEERRKELIFRGLRFSDIKRLNMENPNINLVRKVGNTTYTLKANDEKFALPIPSDIVEITGVKQNPGW